MNRNRRNKLRADDLSLLEYDDADGVQDLICENCGSLVARVERFFDGTGTIELRCWYCLRVCEKSYGEHYPVIKGFTAD